MLSYTLQSLFSVLNYNLLLVENHLIKIIHGTVTSVGENSL